MVSRVVNQLALVVPHFVYLPSEDDNSFVRVVGRDWPQPREAREGVSQGPSSRQAG